jgi:hypothetical protein
MKACVWRPMRVGTSNSAVSGGTLPHDGDADPANPVNVTAPAPLVHLSDPLRAHNSCYA